MTKFEEDIDRFMERQAQHKPHDSCRGASDPMYHEPEDYMDETDQENNDGTSDDK